MTTVTLTSTEARHAKAILLAADAGQWLRPDRLIAGRRAVGIPSQSKRGLYHFTDGHTCSCYDFRRRELPCKHVIAHRLDAIARKPEQPASNVVDGLADMVGDRNPTLTMIRHADGEISWERRPGADGTTIHLPRRLPPSATKTAALAQRYVEIYGGED